MPAKKHIGLFGGTFDPPHNGHTALVEAALGKMELDEVWVIPAEPVHRELSGCADGNTRLNWLRDIFAGRKDVKVVSWEVSSGRPVATIETLRRFQQSYPDIVPWLMLGADAWSGIKSWHEYPQHQKLCNIAIFSRSGVGHLSHHHGWDQVSVCGWSACAAAGHYCEIPVSLPDVSATALRADAAQGVSLSGRVPEKVRRSIEAHYGSAD